jgi:DNA-directed RNA polymerase subunit L
MDLSNWESDETLPGAFRVTSEMSPIVGQVVIHELSQMENVTFQAIRTPHPLEPTTILRVRTKTDSNPQKEWKAAVVKAMGVLSQWIAMVLAC